MNIEDTKTKLDLLVKTLNARSIWKFSIDQLMKFYTNLKEFLPGVGKGYVMIVHILHSLITTDFSKFVIALID